MIARLATDDCERQVISDIRKCGWHCLNLYHGLECSRAGFLGLLPIPGSNVNINNWVEEGPVDFLPRYAPFLPPALERYRGSGPHERERY